MGELHWKTAITDVKPNKICLRGYPLDKLMGKISFAQAIYLVLKGNSRHLMRESSSMRFLSRQWITEPVLPQFLRQGQ